MLIRTAIGGVMVATCAMVSVGAFFDIWKRGQIGDGLVREAYAAPLSTAFRPGVAGSLLVIHAPPGTEPPRGLEEPPEIPSSFEFVHRTEPGDTLSGVLVQLGIHPEEARTAIAALRTEFDPRRLQAGQEVSVTLGLNHEIGGTFQLQAVAFSPAYPDRIGVVRGADGGFDVFRDEVTVTTVTHGGGATIRSSLFADGERAGIAPAVLARLIQLFSWDVDFQRDIHPGDRFAVLYERHETESGEQVRTGAVIAAVLTLSGRRHALFRHIGPDGTPEYFHGDGRSARKTLLRTPIDGARLSSGYGMRRHPILGYSRMHRGVDFAAPPGTPIFAAGDGTVDFVGRNRGFGNYVTIRHQSGYTTLYAHMSRFHRGLQRGQRVRQGDTIGYVGSTGMATGPHLHYEVLKDGRHMNPMDVKSLPGTVLAGRDLERFKAEVAAAERQIARIERESGPTRLAGAER
ncbi:MAG: M23 family peptidase [Rhodospirillales bacterium]|nr:MAG: M23 family peptidase [Rhodospirillales bacterium]